MRLLPIQLLCLAAFVLMPQSSDAAIIVHNSDFIIDTNRTHFNGFETIPVSGVFYSGGSGPYIEDTIQVQQSNGDPGNSIYVDYNWVGRVGSRSWYPSGGDNGFTQVTLAGGVDFQDVGFNYGTGATGDATLILYELLNNGSTVLTGSALLSVTSINYLGFSGGGFDTIRVRDNANHSFASNALVIDSIETQGESPAVPEPGSIAAILSLVSFGAGAIGIRRRRLATPTMEAKL